MNDCESNEHEPYREKSPECAKPPRDTPNATGHQQHLRDSPPFGRSFFEMTEQYVADSKDHGRDCNRHEHGHTCTALIVPIPRGTLRPEIRGGVLVLFGQGWSARPAMKARKLTYISRSQVVGDRRQPYRSE